uniref:Ankyrin repeat domain-containing protein n=1 Tax=Sinocyclocheilus rhinocerous TaxID=307959 RepID=A0A673I8B1_9TELE
SFYTVLFYTVFYTVSLRYWKKVAKSVVITVPLVSRICPSDTYRVWKSGQCLRVDTTLMGFEQMTWQRGNRSFIFRGQDSSAMVMEVDHDRQLVFCETLPCLSSSPTSDEQVAARLSAPVVATQLDTRNISFERHAENLTLQQLFVTL